jgi:Ion channel
VNEGPPIGLVAQVRTVLNRRKYEFLLAALLLHLFVAAGLPDLDLYTRFVWPLNMVLLGLCSVGIFTGRSRAHHALKDVMNLLVVAFPVIPWFIRPSPALMFGLSVSYVAFFVVILVEVMRHLLRPRYINVDLVSAAICGFFLLLETSIFLMQALYYAVPAGFRGIDTASFTTVYLDLVYFCSIVITSIGFGDITPSHHMTKLATSLVGITGQMYSVVLVGILISKYTAATGQSDDRGGGSAAP